MRVRAARVHCGDQIALLQKARRGVVLDRIGELHLEVVILLVARRNADARGRLVLVVGARQRQHQRQARAVGEKRLNLQSMIRPFALQAGDERALERRMGFLLEQIHQRRAGERIVARIAEQLQPRAVGVDDDALLHVRDGVGGALEEVLQLLAVLARRGERGRQGAFQPIGAQLPGDDRG